MKHYIIAKFKDKTDTEKLLPEITALFRKTLELDGVENVAVLVLQIGEVEAVVDVFRSRRAIT